MTELRRTDETYAMLVDVIKSLPCFSISQGEFAATLHKPSFPPPNEGELLAENVDTWPQTVHERTEYWSRRRRDVLERPSLEGRGNHSQNCRILAIGRDKTSVKILTSEQNMQCPISKKKSKKHN